MQNEVRCTTLRARDVKKGEWSHNDGSCVWHTRTCDRRVYLMYNVRYTYSRE